MDDLPYPPLQQFPSLPSLQKLTTSSLRYYQYWIWICSVTVAVVSLGFGGFLLSVVCDERVEAVGITPSHPLLLYPLVSLLIQSTLFQSIGCYGSFRLDPLYLRIYVRMLLGLIVNDFAIGVMWVGRFNFFVQENVRLSGFERRMECCWDPTTCCLPDSTTLPCPPLCTTLISTHIDKLINYLFISGYCVVTFVKVCFYFILKYEVAEMCSKIGSIDELSSFGSRRSSRSGVE